MSESSFPMPGLGASRADLGANIIDDGGSASGATSGATSGSTSGSTSGAASGSTTGPASGSTSGPTSSPDPLVRAALAWQVTLWSGEVTARERQGFARWLAADPAHGRAWQRVQQVNQQLNAVPTTVAGSVLRVTSSAAAYASRRRLLRGLGLLGGGSALAYAVRETLPWRAAMADYRTARGEHQDLTLPDGTRLMLNTRTLVDLRFSGLERRLLLHRGEILIATAPDRAPVHRPFVVETPEGEIRALGTRFTVRHLDEVSPAEVLVRVFGGAVELAPRDGGRPARIAAGYQARFSRASVQPGSLVDPMADAWSRGLLVADHQRLADFLAELGRYRAGVLRCDPAVADLPVSGVYPLRDIDAILQSLVQALPVRVRMTTRYWVTVGPAGS